jgi:hypothetical protein
MCQFFSEWQVEILRQTDFFQQHQMENRIDPYKKNGILLVKIMIEIPKNEA